MGGASKRVRAAVRRDIRIVRGGCPTETDCEAFMRFKTCHGCKKEPFKRAVDWTPSEVTVEARKLADIISEGVTVSLADLSPLVVEALLARREAIDELDREKESGRG